MTIYEKYTRGYKSPTTITIEHRVIDIDAYKRMMRRVRVVAAIAGLALAVAGWWFVQALSAVVDR